MRKLLLATLACLLLVFAPSPAASGDVEATVVASGTSDVQVIAASPSVRLVGFSITEDAGSPAAARVRLHHGTSGAGPELFDVHVAASGSVREWFGNEGPPIPNGLFLDRVSGTARLTVYTRPW